MNSSVPDQHDELPPPVIQRDELDDLIQTSVLQFLASEDWSQFVESARDPRSDWADDLGSLDHPAADLLSYYKEAGHRYSFSGILLLRIYSRLKIIEK